MIVGLIQTISETIYNSWAVSITGAKLLKKFLTPIALSLIIINVGML